jgi:3-hydroxybutyryl-CoA dehydrogenase
MSEAAIQRVLVAGSGVMGRGILATFAKAGFECALLSRHPDKLGALPDGVRAVGTLPREAPDLVIESIPEELDLKLELFRALDQAYGTATILSSNTSGLPLPAVAQALAHPERFCGLHYFQPPETFEFVELIEIAETAPWVAERMKRALERTGKQALHLKKPVAGFLINRLQHAILHEAYHLIEQGVTDAATVDMVARNMLGPRMAVTGLIEQKDISGLDTHALAQQAIVPHLHHGETPSRVVQDLFEAGDLGVKSGRGFYDWTQRDIAAFKRRAADKLARILAIVREP